MSIKSNCRQGYSLLITIFAVAFLSFILSLSSVTFSYYHRKVKKVARVIKEDEIMSKVLFEVFEEFTKYDVEEPVSPYSGWFEALPDSLEGYELTYWPEDSKIDINHLDFSALQKTEMISKEAKLDEYVYNLNKLEAGFISTEAGIVEDVFTIYKVPNLNTADIKKLQLFLDSRKYDESTATGIINKVKEYRGRNNYLQYPGLLIDSNKYELFRSYFDLNSEDDLNKYFDYSGTLNVNFITKEVFSLGYILCSTLKKNKIDQKKMDGIWKKIQAKQEANETIERLQDVFGSNYKQYEKLFSVRSGTFRVTIAQDDRRISAIIRPYSGFSTDVDIVILQTKFYREIEEDVEDDFEIEE